MRLAPVQEPVQSFQHRAARSFSQFRVTSQRANHISQRSSLDHLHCHDVATVSPELTSMAAQLPTSQSTKCDAAFLYKLEV